MPNITRVTKDHIIVNKTRNLLVENSTSELDLWTYLVPGNTLGTTNALHVRIVGSLFNNSGGTVTYTMRWKYGATTLFSDTYPTLAASATRRPIDFDIIFAANGSTSSQVFGGYMMLSVATAATTGTGDLATDEQQGISPIEGGTSSVDSTSDQTLKLTLQMSSANASAEILITHAYVELIK